MDRRLALVAFALTVFALPARAADDLNGIFLLNQTEFRLLSAALGAALSYKAVLPAEPLGVTGFDLGIEATYVELSNSYVFDIATLGGSPTALVIPKLHVHKGLPFGIDIGAFLATVPDSNISNWGAELRYAILKGSTTTPAVAVRGSYTALTGVDQLDLNTTGLDVSISKGFAFLTPYAGIGKVWVNSSPQGIPTLTKEDFDLNKYYLGLNMNFAFINIALEGDKTGDTNSYSLKLGWRF